MTKGEPFFLLVWLLWAFLWESPNQMNKSWGRTENLEWGLKCLTLNRYRVILLFYKLHTIRSLLALYTFFYFFCTTVWFIYIQRDRHSGSVYGRLGRFAFNWLLGATLSTLAGYWHSAWSLQLTFASLYVILLSMRKESMSLNSRCISCFQLLRRLARRHGVDPADWISAVRVLSRPK